VSNGNNGEREPNHFKNPLLIVFVGRAVIQGYSFSNQSLLKSFVLGI
jgi:hypothetical protein